MKGSRFFPKDATAVVVLLVSAFFFVFAKWYPIINTFLLSFKEATFFKESWIGLDNYKTLFFEDKVTLQTFGNTLKFALMVVPTTALLGLALALFVHQIKSYAVRSLFNAAFFVPFVVPIVAIAIVWKFMFQSSEIGLFNQVLGLFNIGPVRWLKNPRISLASLAFLSVWKRAGYAMIIYLAGLLAIPETFYEAARVEGASAWQRFRRITLPLLTPTTLFVVVVITIGSLMVFETPYVMTTEDFPGSIPGGPANSTNVVVLNIYQQAFRFNHIGYASASAVLLFVMIFTISFIQFKFISQRYEY